ncbi:MAG: flagellar assembly peptidoglycan hydrolase FlgJ [Betaproteobacteria bacterium]|nr:MAG: flagellar assembly peptidoglycan hydrolase FlgJ [Betaproteobacteria bacterium]
MIGGPDPSANLALDVGSVEALKRESRTNPDRALRSAASQFEALLMQMMLKSMREAADSASSTDSQDTKLYKSMLDQQLALALAKRGIGLADVMVRQLGRAAAAAPESASGDPDSAGIEPMRPPAERRITPLGANAPAQFDAVPNVPASTSTPAAPAAAPAVPEAARAFVSRLWPHAQEAARTTGVAPHFILGQAALESGWGRSEIRMADGSPSHNLFGIKAGRGWQGPTADVVTTEYVNGTAVKTMERFRAYGSYAEAFKDYASLLTANPRYAHVLNERADPAAFARGLQRAGYATDPNYADKLTRVITGAVMRLGLSG